MAGAWDEDGVFSHDDLFARRDSPSEPLSHLVESVERLRAKTIPQAYFWLTSPQVPHSTIFMPDGKGGGFVLIGRVFKMAEGIDPQVVLTKRKKHGRTRSPCYSIGKIADCYIIRMKTGVTSSKQ